jgi:hypothetical protein
LVVAALAFGTGAAATPRAPQPVSPGAQSASAVSEARCPTFSWAGVDGAPGYQIAVFLVSSDSSDPAAEPALVIRAAVPGNALAWTPPVGRCFERGARYAWSVAVAAPYARAERLAWSAPFLFEVEAAPSRYELEQAVATIERHLRMVEPDAGPPATATGAESRRRALPSPASSHDLPLAGGGLTRPAAPRVASSVTTPALGPASLSVQRSIDLSTPQSALLKEGEAFLWDDAAGNTALGRDALVSVSGTADHNTALGRNALRDTVEGGDPLMGSYNTAVGDGALAANTYGFYNTATGFEALTTSSLGLRSTATGFKALRALTTGDDNTAVGSEAMLATTTGFRSTAMGSMSLRANTTGYGNVAIGFQALLTNGTGHRNTATGVGALLDNTNGYGNTALGYGALHENTAGFDNTAVGRAALYANLTGDRNTAIGKNAGSSNLTGNDNVFIANVGANAESGAIRIGTSGTHTQTFVAGIHSQAVDGASDLPVFVDASGKLGTGPSTSSRRVKQDIVDLGPLPRRLLELRPVAFRYREDAARDPEGPRQFGLIAEEVAEVLPELVLFDPAGRPQAVKYHLLNVLLVGQLQRQHEMLERQLAENADLRRRLEALEARGTRADSAHGWE